VGGIGRQRFYRRVRFVRGERVKALGDSWHTPAPKKMQALFFIGNIP
jgi:hypothetical protein